MSLSRSILYSAKTKNVPSDGELNETLGIHISILYLCVDRLVPQVLEQSAAKVASTLATDSYQNDIQYYEL